MSAVVYGLYPFREPDPANLVPMRASDLNCVARVALNHLESASRGHRLTAARRAKIDAWEVGIHEAGTTLQDRTGLEAATWRAVIVRDIAGEIIHSSSKYGDRKPVEITLHNSHAWGPELAFPRAREVRTYAGDVWEAIREAVADELMAV